MPLLRRANDHRRNVRRSAPRAIAIANPDRDRHLMIVAALPASQPRFPLSATASEQEADVRTNSPVLLRPPRLRQARPLPRPNAPSLFALAAKTVATRHSLDKDAPSAILKSP